MTNPSDTLQIFSTVVEHSEIREPRAENLYPRWQSAAVCDWPDKQKDLESTAKSIAEATGLRFTSKLIFAEERALFFWSFPMEASKVVTKKTITLEGKSVYLNKWNTSVNIIDLHKSRFEGWISIKGLPFDNGTEMTLTRLEVCAEALLEVDRQTTGVCIEVKIKVRSPRAATSHT